MKYPQQGSWLNRKVQVCFNYDTTNSVNGVIVRDDVAEPFLTIIKLDDGRHVMSTECLYRVLPGGDV